MYIHIYSFKAQETHAQSALSAQKRFRKFWTLGQKGQTAIHTYVHTRTECRLNENCKTFTVSRWEWQEMTIHTQNVKRISAYEL